jgi:hypothetical protein
MAYIKIGGSALIALGLFAFLALSMGISFNQLVTGLGNLLIGLGILVVVVLIILAIFTVYKS